MQGQEEIAARIIDFSNSMLENAKGGVIAGIGIVFMLWAIIKVLSNIENSFNEIWGVKKARHIGRKFSDYLSMMLVCPILLVMSSSITVLISSQIKDIVMESELFSSVGPYVLLPLKLLPLCTIWVTFTFIFIFMPNTKVKFNSALLGGIVAGTIFQIVQWGYINFQIGAAKYGAIYGSFAALPLFLLWLHISWLVVLFGAEYSFAHQNVETYEFEQDCLLVSHSFKRLLSLLITQLLVKNFCRVEQALDSSMISQKLEIPIRLVRQILYELVEAGIVCEVRKEVEKDMAYQPASDVDKFTVKYVVDTLEGYGNDAIPVLESNELTQLSNCLDAFGNTIKNLPENRLLKDI